MTSIVEQLRNAALALPEEDCVDLIEALIVSLETADQPPFDDSWREVIRRRSAELRSGTVTPIPWSEVKQQAREPSRG